MKAELIRGVAQLSGLARSVLDPRSAPPGAIVLGYHDVTPDGTASSPYTVSARDLASHLDALIAAGYRLVDLNTVLDAHQDPASLDRLAAITFDDGYRGFADTAAPILAARAAPATVFCCSDLLGAVPWWSTTGQPLADASEILTLPELPGISVGAHGRHHVALSALDEPTQNDQISGCKDRLEQLLARPVPFFAYPYGSYSQQTPALAAAAGFRASFTFANGRVTGRTSPHLIPRLVMHDGQQGWRWRYTLSRPDSSFPARTDTVHATGPANVFPKDPIG